MQIHAMQLLAVVATIPLVTALAIGPSPAGGAIQARTPTLETRAAPSDIFDLTVAFNNDKALSLIAGALPDGTTSRSGIELAWMPWGNVPGPVKPRANFDHKDTDIVIRAMMKVHVNTPWWCAAVDGHIVYYIFPDNNGLTLQGVVDGWDTLTDNGSACDSEVNDGLRTQVKANIGLIQTLIDAEFANLPQEHFGSFFLRPPWMETVDSTVDVEIVLQRDTIVSRWNGLCMDVQGAIFTAGALIQQSTCNDSPPQKFDKLPTPDGFFLIQSQHSKMCMAVDGGSTANGALLALHECNDLDNSQQWNSSDSGVGNTIGSKWLINRNSQKCVDVPGWSQTAGTLLQQLDCNGEWKDYWYNV